MIALTILRAVVLTIALCFTSILGWTGRDAYSQNRNPDPPSSEQTYTFFLNGVPLSDALDVLIDETDINLFYESEMVEGKTTFCAIENRLIEDVLRCILRRTELDFYRLSSGMYVLIDRPRAEAKFGALAGLVLDAQTGEPLPDASILLAYAETGTATNNDGRFALSQLNPGLHPIIVTHVAYEDYYDSLYVAAGEETSIRLDLQPRTFISAPIVIDGLQERMPSEKLETRRIAAEELILTPSHTPSTHEALNDIVGVGGGDAFSDIHVQGGDSGEHLYALDGIPVFVPIRNGGFFGAFSPFALSQVTVHKAGFDATEGSYLAGVIDIEHELITDRETVLDVQIDPLSANARLQGQINRLEPLQMSWMVTGRLGLWDIFQPGPIEQQLLAWSRPNTFVYDNLVPGAANDSSTTTVDPSNLEVRFSDIHAATRIRLGTKRSLYLSLYKGRNVFGDGDLSIDPERVEGGNEDYRWTNQMQQARYEWVAGHSTFAHIGVWSSDYRLRHPVDRFPFSPGDTTEEESDHEGEEEVEAEDFNEISELGIKAGFDMALGSRHTLSVGIEPIFTASKFLLSVDPSGQTDPISHSLIRPAKTRIQSFVQDDMALSDRTQLKAGSRFTYVPSQKRLYAEPRLSIRHDIPDGAGGAWAVYAATGLYRQFIFQFDVSDYNQSTLLPGFRFWLPLGQDTRASTAYHAAAGLLYIPTEEWQIRAEGYYKHQPQLAVLDYVSKNGIRNAEGYAYGAGLSITYDIPRVRIQAHYEYGQARRRIANRFGGDYVQVPWSAPHQLHANVEVRLLDGMIATLGWEGIYNRTWAYRQAYYDYLEPDNPQLQDTTQTLFSSPNQDILPAFSQVDLGLSYNMNVGRFRVQARLTALNVFDRKNIFDWVIEEESAIQTRTNRFTTPFYSSASIRVRY